MNPQENLRNLTPEHPFFVGFDSDGCVFDTMEIKQKECFCPNFIRFFNLQAASKYVRETWEFVNLYSSHRGCNRFIAVVETFRLLKQRPEVKARGVKLPDTSPLEAWIASESKLGNPALEAFVQSHPDPFLLQVLQWSKKVNADIAEMVKGIGPFPFVRESLEFLSEKADMIVVSQTPTEALKREWEEHALHGFMRFIAGQECGTKSEHLALTAKDKYPSDKILMIGDAPGDLKAARNNKALFFPVNPGHEEASWERLYREGMHRFLAGTYQGDYENNLIGDFLKLLPEKPSWNTIP